MKKLIDLPDTVIENLEAEAKEQKRSLKAHLEYILIRYSNQLETDKYIGLHEKLED